MVRDTFTWTYSRCQRWLCGRWYGAGGAIQVGMFGMIASKVKMNANGAHTFLEIVKVRFGTAGHVLFTIYAFLCILIVCGSLLRSYNSPWSILNRLLSPILSWRVCDSQCAHRDERQRGVFLAANWDRGLRHFRRSTCDVHL